MLLRRARACAGTMAPERSPTVGRTIVIVTCPSSDQGQMSSFSAESGWASETSSLRSDLQSTSTPTDTQLLHLPAALVTLITLATPTALATRLRWFTRRRKVRCPPPLPRQL